MVLPDLYVYVSLLLKDPYVGCTYTVRLDQHYKEIAFKACVNDSD